MKLLKIGILLVIITLIVTQTNVLDVFKPKTAYAVGDLNVNWGGGITPGDPIFNVSNMAPGDGTTRSVTITNNSTNGRPVAVKGANLTATNSLSGAMEITIKDGSTILYGPKTLTDFLSDSQNPEGIALGTLNPESTQTITFTVTFKESSGNEFQDSQMTFDIVIGIGFAIPQACQSIDLTGKFPIFGTSGNDTINGTNKADVIFGLEGDDKIDGGNNGDCIIGGAGNDRLNLGNGKDIAFGDSGDDQIDGGNDADLLLGNDGDDTISGGNGNDTIEGGSGNDMIESGNGKDNVRGNDDNDNIKGGNENDILTGGNGVDSINGDLGKDTCAGESIKNCEAAL